MVSEESCCTLYTSSGVSVTLSEGRLLQISASESAVSLSEDDVSAVLMETEKLLAEKVSFRTMWDLRNCPIPSVAIATRCIRWALKNKTALDKFNSRLGVVVPPRPALLKLVESVLWVFAPSCEVHVGTNHSQAKAFMALA